MTAVLGSTVAEAAKLIRHKAHAYAAQALDVSAEDVEFTDGLYVARASNKNISLEELVKMQKADSAPHIFSTKHSYKTQGASYPYGAHIAEIEIDPADCRPQIQRYTVVDDFGVVVNPLTLHGQIHGGIAQGVGQALYEYMVYDDFGQLLSGSLMDYTLPRADHLPAFDIYTRNTPCVHNALGVKGSGEAGAIGAPPAVISAVCDALSIAHIDMPATPQSIFNHLSATGKL